MSKNYKNHLEFMDYIQRKEEELMFNKDFSEKIVLIVEIELLDEREDNDETIEEVRGKVQDER